MAEDTNADGQPDLWETYDEAEALVERSKDLNFDGVPDLVDGVSQNQERPSGPKDESPDMDGQGEA